MQRQLIVNGEVLGRYGATADHSYDGTVFAQMGTFFKSDSEFSFGYQPIDGNYRPAVRAPMRWPRGTRCRRSPRGRTGMRISGT